MISLVLLIKNAAQFLPKLFRALEKQKGVGEFGAVGKAEVIIVDSGSRDGSWEMLKNWSNKLNWTNSPNWLKEKIRFFQIKPNEFGHGKTRNFAVQKAKGEIVVFLSQDALPKDENWLKNLIRPLVLKSNVNYCSSAARTSRFARRINNIGGVFGRQIPYPKTNLCEKYFYSISYPDKGRVLTKKDSESFSNQNLFFSNVNGAARRDLLLKFPFREDLVMSEDQFWGREVLRHNYKIIYEPKAGVWHSHNYNLRQLFKRYFQSGYSQRQMELSGAVFKKGLGTALGLLGFLGKLGKKGFWLLPYGVVYEFVKGIGFLLGRKGILPRILEKRILQ